MQAVQEVRERCPHCGGPLKFCATCKEHECLCVCEPCLQCGYVLHGADTYYTPDGRPICAECAEILEK